MRLRLSMSWLTEARPSWMEDARWVETPSLSLSSTLTLALVAVPKVMINGKQIVLN